MDGWLLSGKRVTPQAAFVGAPDGSPDSAAFLHWPGHPAVWFFSSVTKPVPPARAPLLGKSIVCRLSSFLPGCHSRHSEREEPPALPGTALLLRRSMRRDDVVAKNTRSQQQGWRGASAPNRQRHDGEMGPQRDGGWE